MLRRALRRSIAARSAIRTTRGSKALLLTVGVAASALTAVVSVPEVAHAATTVTGTVQPGVPTTVTLLGGDDAQFAVDIPADVLPTLRITQLTPGATILTALIGPETNAGTFVDGDNPVSWYTEFGPVTTQPGAGTLSITAFNTGSITFTFTLGFARETTVPVTAGQDVTLSFDTPGDRSLLTFDAHAGFEVSATVVANNLSGLPANSFLQQLGLALQTEFGPQGLPGGDGIHFGPGITSTTGPQTLAVDPAADVTGSVTLHLDLARQQSGTLQYGRAAVPVVLDEPGLERRYGLSAQGDAATVFQVLAPDLLHADGTPGTATVEILVAGSPARVLGTVTGSTPVTFSTGTPLEAGQVVGVPATPVAVRVLPDPTTTGTFGLRMTLDSAATTPLTPGVGADFSVPFGAAAARLTVDLPAGAYEVALDSVASTDPESIAAAATLFVVAPDGTVGCEQPVLGAAFFTCIADSAGLHTVEILRDQGSAGSGVRAHLTVSPVVTSTVRAAVPTDQLVTTTVPGQRVEVVVPGLAGQVVVAQLADEQWTIPEAWTGSAGAALQLLDDAGNDLAVGPRGQYAETGRLTADTDVHILVDPAVLSVGSARLLVTAPQDVAGTLVAGTTQPVDITQPGARAVLSVDAVAGRPLALSIDSALGDGDVLILSPAGEMIGAGVFRTGITSWAETFEPIAATGTYTVVLDPTFNSTAALTVQTLLPVVTTRAVRSGQTVPLVFGPGDQQRLTFTAAAGRRPVLRLTTDPTVSWQGQVTLLDASGTALETAFISPLFSYTEFATLPARGTYTLLVDLSGSAATSFSAQLLVAADQTVRARPGRPATVSWGVGQRTTIEIPVGKGEHPAVDLRAARLAGGSQFVNVQLFQPGRDFSVAQVFLGGDIGQTLPAWLESVGDTRVATADEVWRLQVVPFAGTTGAIDYVAYSVKDPSQNLRLGRATKVTVTSPAVNVRMPFTVPATSTGTLHWTITGSTFAHGVRLLAITPTGFGDFIAVLPAGSSSGSGTAFNYFGPSTATLIVDPIDGSTGTAVVTVTVDP